MMRRPLQGLLNSATTVRFFTTGQLTPARTAKTQSQLLTSTLAVYPSQLFHAAVKSFPIEDVVAQAATRHAYRARDAYNLMAERYQNDAFKKDTAAFEEKHHVATKMYVQNVMSTFLLKFQEELAKNTEELFYDIFDRVATNFARTYPVKSSINDGLLAPELKPDLIIRLYLYPALEKLAEQLKTTEFVMNKAEPTPVCQVTFRYSPGR